MKQILLTFICASTFGFTKAQDNWGAKAGLNYNGGVHVGVFAGFKIAEKLTIQPEFMYRSYQNYLALPVLIKYTTTSGFYGETGPQVAYLLGENWDPTYYNRVDFSWAIGIGYKTAKNLGIDLRYNYGFIPVLDHFEGRADNYNRELQLGVFYVLKNK